MKKASCVLIIVLLLLLEISAKAEWVSIVELRQQVDEMGRWIQNYTDTYGRQIEVDVLPMIPDVEVVPVPTGRAAGCRAGSNSSGYTVDYDG